MHISFLFNNLRGDRFKALLIITLSCFFTNGVLAAESPNIILILTDDQGWTGTSLQMDKRDPRSKSDFYETPNLERLGSQGMRFSRGYSASPVCGPSRTSIQTGLSTVRLNYFTVTQGPQIPQNQFTTYSIPRTLKSIDPKYKAAHFGKWHVGKRRGQHQFLPEEDAGYDESHGWTTNGNGGYGGAGGTKRYAENVVDDPKLIFKVTNDAIDFMNRQDEAGNPFYLQVSHYACHTDIQNTQRNLDRFKNKRPGNIHTSAPYAGMTADLDNSLGLLLDAVEKLSSKDNTYIIYTSDNGAVSEMPGKHPATFTKLHDNYPLMGGKWDAFEGGVRVPFIISGPGVPMNSQSDVSVIGYDLYPTFADLAGGLSVLEGVTLDGGSFKSLLTDGQGTVNRGSEVMVTHYSKEAYGGVLRIHSSAQIGDWKLLKFWDVDETRLYNVGKESNQWTEYMVDNESISTLLETALDDYLRAHNIDKNVEIPDGINIISGPVFVTKGQEVTLSVQYKASEERDVIITLQNNKNQIYSKSERISVPVGKGILDVKMTLDKANINVGDDNYYYARILPKNSSNKLELSKLGGVSVVSNVTNEKISLNKAPSSVVAGTEVAIEVEYNSPQARTLLLTLLNKEENDRHYAQVLKRINGRQNTFTVQVPIAENAPNGQNYEWEVKLIPIGKDWSEKVAVATQKVSIVASE